MRYIPYWFQVMENRAEDWELLVEGFLEYRRAGVPTSGIAGMQTPEGREIMTQSLKHMGRWS